MTVHVLFFPKIPHRSSTVGRICESLGYAVTGNAQHGFDAAVKWNHGTLFADSRCGSSECEDVINGGSTDLSRRNVGHLFADVFGYRLNVDPQTHIGEAISKSNGSAAEDGKVVHCPLAADQVDRERVYQKRIDHSISTYLVRDYRVPFFAAEIPFVYQVDHSIGTSFGGDPPRVEVAETAKVLSRQECAQITQFTRGIGLDFGELDVRRDADGLLYIVAANEDLGEGSQFLSPKKAQEAIVRLADSFARMIRDRVKMPRRRIVILQSCDDGYAGLLEVTAPVNSSYAMKHGHSFHAEIGNLSPIPRMANWNRYYLLRDEIEKGIHDWAFWMDADAIVKDHTRSLDWIIDRSPDKVLIACRGSHNGEHDINNGVFLLNLRRPLAKDLVEYAIASGEQTDPQHHGFRADQPTMHRWLWQHRDEAGRIVISRCYTDREHDLFNYNGRFVRHVLREHGPLQARRATLMQTAQAIRLGG